MPIKNTGQVIYHGEKQPYAKSIVCEGKLVFCSGASAQTFETGEVRSDDVRAQVWDALDKIKKYLEDAGARLEDIVWMLNLVKDMGDIDTIKKAREDYYREHAPSLVDNPPCVTGLQVGSLVKANAKVEMAVIACIPR
jgi:enamine deaminase RidA (YjgF/YER057c/UK114 family)